MSIHTINVGDRVEGVYCGVPYRGTVTSHRPHTMNHRIELFNVDLDSPIDVFGEVRTSLHTAASDDREALARYNRVETGDYLQAVA